MKYKIQTGAVTGWADLKYSEDDGKTYHPDLYDTKAEALDALDSLVTDLDDFEGRVVTEDTPQDFDLY
jgi:hypothetical protein